MAHPGFNFSRRSYHTLAYLSCRWRAYLNQILQIRRGPGPSGWDGPLAVGKIYHTLQEVNYLPESARGRVRLNGTDGNPVLATFEDVYRHYASQGYSAKALCEAQEGFERYQYSHADDDFRDRVIGRPEPDVASDLRTLLPKRRGQSKIPYQAQYDLVLRHPNGREVMAAEHKLLRAYYPQTLATYQHSGQLHGQCAVWNANPGLVAKFGPMRSVQLNLAFKTGKDKLVHRESISVSATRQRRYVKLVDHYTHVIVRLNSAYKRAVTPEEVRHVWAQTGIMSNECVRIGANCEFLAICDNDGIVTGDLYQITEAGRAIAERDRAVQLEDVETYTCP